jgi:hypothetical protein
MTTVIGLQTERLSTSARVARISLAIAILVVFAAVFLSEPDSLPLPACAFRNLTGHSCFACGMTRSLHAIAHGEVLASVHYHLMGPLMFAVMLLGFLRWTAEGCSGRRIRAGIGAVARRWAMSAILVTWVLFGVIRLGVELAH